MNLPSSADITVIGGGIVGLATAYQFQKKYPQYHFLVLEKEPEVGEHQTSHNSGVIHSGIYYPPGSLKAKLCVEGAWEMVRFAQENHIPHELCGKIIVATEKKELDWLNTLYERGLANGIPEVKILNSEQIKEIEPHATGIRAIHSPKTGIINFQLVAKTFKRKLVENGHSVVTSCELKKMRKSGGWILSTSQGDVQTKFFVNCGGLYSDRIAKLSGVNPHTSIIPFRGEYFLIKPEKQYLVKNLIYPLPQPSLPFLGVHFTKTIDRKMEVGPNAVLALAREAYQRKQFDINDIGEMLLNRAFWKMVFKYWKTGIFESHKALSKSAFVRELRKFVPEINEEDLMPGPSGIRAQAIDESGNLVNDFKIAEMDSAIHVLNVPSPAATASLTIGNYIVKLSASVFSLKN